MAVAIIFATLSALSSACGAVLQRLAVLAAGVVMLSLWAPPVMTADELARLPGHAHSDEGPPVIASVEPELPAKGIEPD